MSESGRRINRTLTQKYDMNALRALQKLETQLTGQLSASLGVEEDDLPIEIDLLRIYNLEVGDREKELREMFAGLPSGQDPIIANLLEEFAKVDALPKK